MTMMMMRCEVETADSGSNGFITGWGNRRWQKLMSSLRKSHQHFTLQCTRNSCRIIRGWTKDTKGARQWQWQGGASFLKRELTTRINHSSWHRWHRAKKQIGGRLLKEHDDDDNSDDDAETCQRNGEAHRWQFENAIRLRLIRHQHQHQQQACVRGSRCRSPFP